MISKNTVVSMSYLLKDDAGKELDRSDNNEPLSYLHGHSQIVPGLEKALEGLKVGDKKEVSLTPTEGYGEMVPDLRLKMPRSKFPEEMEIQPGLQFEANLGEKRHVFTIVEQEGDDVKIDGNHPLAGQNLHFSVEVMEVREATAEELQHGHAHGAGGHHH